MGRRIGQKSGERTDQKVIVPVAADIRIIDLAVIVPHTCLLYTSFLLPEDAEYATAYGAFATRMHEMPSVAPVI